MKRIFNLHGKEGFSLIECLAASLIFFMLFQLSFNLLLLQKKFINQNFLKAEYQRQINFAESWLRRDLFESKESRALARNELEVINYSNQSIKYYLAQDPYQAESWQGKSERTLYRKVGGAQGQPLTQFNSGFFTWEENYLGYRKLFIVLEAGDARLSLEEIYEIE